MTAAAALSDAELQRYAPQIALGEIAARGQKVLKDSHVLLVGAGGLGSVAASYLAAAGVGRLTIVDDDDVALSNLSRQFLYGEADLGCSKAERAAVALRRVNPLCDIKTRRVRLRADNAEEILKSCQIVLDCSDNIATRLIVNDVCFFMRKVLVSAAIGRWGGLLSTFRSFERDSFGSPLPSYRCLVGDGSGLSEVSCAEDGILGAVCGVMGSWAAAEAVKEITGAGRSLAGRLLIYDALEPSLRIVGLPWDSGNALGGLKA